MIIAMSCTKDWYHYLMVDIFSLLECTKTVKKIYLLVETENIDEIPYLRNIIQKYNYVEIVLVNVYKYLNQNISSNCPNLDTPYGTLSLSRLLLPEIVEEDKALYIDTDAIVRKDISKVWKYYDISDYYVAGVRDYGILADGIIQRYNIIGKYINSGFVLFNLKKIREENIQEQWFNLINNQKLVYPDQDALNIVCQHKELYIPSMYNSCECYGDRITLSIMNPELTKVFHYAGPKEQWLADRYHAEEWYDAEEKFYDEFCNS